MSERTVRGVGAGSRVGIALGLAIVGGVGGVGVLGAGCGSVTDGGGAADDTAAGALVTAADAGVATGMIASPAPASTTDERRHLVYELILVNTDPARALHVARVDVSDADRGDALGTFRDDTPAGLFSDLGTGDPSDGTVAPGAGVVIFVDLALARAARLPRDLGHRIVIARGDRMARVAGPVVPVTTDGARPLGPPLHGERLINLGGCCASAHTRAFFVSGAGVFLSQRFAIDFERVDEQGTFVGDPTKNESYFLFGADVVAAEAGRVVEASDGLPENVPPQLPPFDLATAAGNHVIEALDDGRFALYAHLKTGSVRVRAGDRIRRGQVLGQVGNTGHASEPHLHFQVMDAPATFEANGVPYTFDRFQFQATVDLSVAEPVATPVPAPEARRERLPMTGDIVAFP